MAINLVKRRRAFPFLLKGYVVWPLNVRHQYGLIPFENYVLKKTYVPKREGCNMRLDVSIDDFSVELSLFVSCCKTQMFT